MGKEIYKDIPGYEGLYKASNFGNIKSLRNNHGKDREKILKSHTIDKYGYQSIELRKNKKRNSLLVHRLVLLTFVGPCPSGTEGCHKDSNPRNNKLENLRWDTPKNNTKDMILRGTRFQYDNKGSKHPLSKLNVWKVRIIKKLLENNYLTQKEIGKIFNVSHITICDIKSGKLWKHVL